MYPINIEYVQRPFFADDGKIETISPNEIDWVVNQAKQVCSLLESGFEFMKTQPDFNQLKEIMISQKK